MEQYSKQGFKNSTSYGICARYKAYLFVEALQFYTPEVISRNMSTLRI